MSSTEDLVVMAKEGNHVAFSQLVSAEAKWAFATARLIVRSRSDAEDAFQEAVLRAWRDLPGLRRPERWRPWFRRIVTNAAIDGARANKRAGALCRLPIGIQEDPEDHVAAKDEVWRMLRSLSTAERALLVLRFGHDLEIAEVARLMGQPAGTTKSNLHRLLRKLRDREGGQA